MINPPSPAAAKPVIASCRKKKSEEATFLEDLKDHVNEFIHASRRPSKRCLKCQKVTARSVDVKEVKSSLPLQTTVADYLLFKS